MDNINEEAYTYLFRAAFSAFTEKDFKPIKDAIEIGTRKIDTWWLYRIDHINEDLFISDEAKRLTKRILDRNVLSGVSLRVLPPETVGMMLNTLVHTYVFNREEKQEKAIYMLLAGAVRSWRKFVEVLAHMNVEGKKQSSDDALVKNLKRINYILDGDQQKEFNQWIAQLASVNYLENMGMVPKKFPFTPSSPHLKIKRNNLKP